jgi:hypothetical protein
MSTPLHRGIDPHLPNLATPAPCIKRMSSKSFPQAMPLNQNLSNLSNLIVLAGSPSRDPVSSIVIVHALRVRTSSTGHQSCVQNFALAVSAKEQAVQSFVLHQCHKIQRCSYYCLRSANRRMIQMGLLLALSATIPTCSEQK